MKTQTARFLLSCLILTAATDLHAAVITDRSTVTGSAAIDPDGDQTIDTIAAAAGPTQATLEARSDFRVIQDFSGLDSYIGTPASAVNTLSFTGTTLPDIRLRIDTAYGDPSTSTTNSGSFNSQAVRTSPNGGWNLRAAGTGSGDVRGIIEFGTYDGSTFTLGGIGVEAVAFTQAGLRDVLHPTVQYYNTSGVLLHTQTQVSNNVDPQSVGGSGSQTDPDGPGGLQSIDTFYSYQATSLATDDLISYVVITKNQAGTANLDGIIDDLGFTNAMAQSRNPRAARF